MTEAEPRPNPTEQEQAPSANATAEHLHNTFLGKNTVLTPDQIKASRVHLDNSRENTTRRLIVFGEVDGKPAYQTLGYSTRNSKWYFTTTFTEYGGAVIQHHIGGKNDRDPEVLAALNSSIFAQKIQEATGETK